MNSFDLTDQPCKDLVSFHNERKKAETTAGSVRRDRLGSLFECLKGGSTAPVQLLHEPASIKQNFEHVLIIELPVQAGFLPPVRSGVTSVATKITTHNS